MFSLPGGDHTDTPTNLIGREWLLYTGGHAVT